MSKNIETLAENIFIKLLHPTYTVNEAYNTAKKSFEYANMFYKFKHDNPEKLFPDTINIENNLPDYKAPINKHLTIEEPTDDLPF